MNGFKTPDPQNELLRNYTPESPDYLKLKAELNRQLGQDLDVPMCIGGHDIWCETRTDIRCPHDTSHKLGSYQTARSEDVDQAIRAALRASKDWASVSWQDRAAVFLKAADLLAEKYREVLNAATMLGQSKTVNQAEIDSGCELTDFLRFNPYFMSKIYDIQPIRHARGTWNSSSYRPLEGFVFAVTPFNFTAIAGNLPTAPAMMGNVVVWKPASSAILSAHYFMQILKEAGLPDGVINLVTGRGRELGDRIIDHHLFAGIHFTGSTSVFNGMWKRVGTNLSQNKYRSYPRLVGETGGKGFVIAAPDADVESLANALFKGAFEYQGQKCSAASRAYIPRSLWPEIKERLANDIAANPPGDITNFNTFMGAVIDQTAFEKITAAIERAKESDDSDIVIGGDYQAEKGWFIQQTVIETTNPESETMVEELFGPVLSVYVYDDDDLDKALALVDSTSPYALTGAIFAKERKLIRHMTDALENAAGNFYINDKPTGAIVGQQPFGGARLSGTNDKAGSLVNLMRWTSMRVTKESFLPVMPHRVSLDDNPVQSERTAYQITSPI